MNTVRNDVSGLYHIIHSETSSNIKKIELDYIYFGFDLFIYSQDNGSTGLV